MRWSLPPRATSPLRKLPASPDLCKANDQPGKHRRPNLVVATAGLVDTIPPPPQDQALQRSLKGVEQPVVGYPRLGVPTPLGHTVVPLVPPAQRFDNQRRRYEVRRSL